MVKQYVAEALKGVEKIKQQLEGYEDRTSLLRLNTEHIGPVCGAYVVTSNVVDSTVIRLGTSRAQLDTNVLGMVYSSSGPIRIGSPGDVFKERFVNTAFINTSDTTASVHTTTNEWSVIFSEDTVESLISEKIFYDDSSTYNISALTIEAIGTNTDKATYSITTNGSTWSNVELNTYTEVTEGNQLSYIVKNSTSSTITVWGSPWGSPWFVPETNPITITELKITYDRA